MKTYYAIDRFINNDIKCKVEQHCIKFLSKSLFELETDNDFAQFSKFLHRVLKTFIRNGIIGKHLTLKDIFSAYDAEEKTLKIYTTDYNKNETVEVPKML